MKYVLIGLLLCMAGLILSPHWQLRSGLAHSHIRFDRFIDGNNDCGGRRNPFVPKLTEHIGLRHEHRSDWYAQASLCAVSKVYLDATNQYKRNGYGQVDLITGFLHGDLNFSVYVKNLNHNIFDAVGYPNGFVTVYSPPREIGLRLAWRM